MKIRGDWLQIGANVGILCGLMLVGVQIADANRFARAEMMSSNISLSMQVELSLLGKNPDAAMYRILVEPDRATARDRFVADRVYGAMMRLMTRAIVLNEQGLYGVDGVDLEGFVFIHSTLFACPYGLAYLEQIIATMDPDGTSEHPVLGMLRQIRGIAEQRMRADTFTDRHGRMEEIQRALQSLQP